MKFPKRIMFCISLVTLSAFLFSSISFALPTNYNYVSKHKLHPGKIDLPLQKKFETELSNDIYGEPFSAHNAIVDLIEARDNDYMQAVNSVGTANLMPKMKPGKFAAGHDVCELLTKNKQAIISVNVISYNQIEGHIKAAINQNAILWLEVARSQLGYALDENKVIEYVRKTMKKLGSTIPIVVHGDHIQYSEALFSTKKILKAVYEDLNGKGSFNDSIKIDDIDKSILEEVAKQLKENAEKERVTITKINERLIKAGFTSIAIDASTLYDEVAGDIVLNYYEKNGSEEEKLISVLEKNFALPVEWGTELLKLDPTKKKAQAKFKELKKEVISAMKSRDRSQDEINITVGEMRAVFGILVKKAKDNNLNSKDVIAAYDKIMEELAEATIAGKIKEEILKTVSDKEKLLLLPSNNAAETAYQLEKIDELLTEYNPNLVNHFGKEIEVGHVDRKYPNPRRDGKMEAKMTHPLAVRVMGEYLKYRRLSFDLIATNNGSGHGTDYDKETLTPVSQVGKISPYLTRELQEEAAAFGASIAQHGTSGSDMDELNALAKSGVIKFNIATNYQQIILNIVSLLDDGFKGNKLRKYVIANKKALVAGLHKDVRTKILKFAKKVKNNHSIAEVKDNDNLFNQFLKLTYAWGISKKKIKDNSSDKDIGIVIAKEFKRVFGKMDEGLVGLTVPAPVMGGNSKMGANSIAQALKILENKGIKLIEFKGARGDIAVFEAEDVKTGEKGVVKVVAPKDGQGKFLPADGTNEKYNAVVKSFTNGLEALKSLGAHQWLPFIKKAGKNWAFMTYLEGKNARSMIQDGSLINMFNKGELGTWKMFNIFEQITDKLNYIHSNDVFFPCNMGAENLIINPNPGNLTVSFSGFTGAVQESNIDNKRMKDNIRSLAFILYNMVTGEEHIIPKAEIEEIFLFDIDKGISTEKVTVDKAKSYTGYKEALKERMISNGIFDGLNYGAKKEVKDAVQKAQSAVRGKKKKSTAGKQAKKQAIAKLKAEYADKLAEIIIKGKTRVYGSVAEMHNDLDELRLEVFEGASFIPGNAHRLAEPTLKQPVVVGIELSGVAFNKVNDKNKIFDSYIRQIVGDPDIIPVIYGLNDVKEFARFLSYNTAHRSLKANVLMSNDNLVINGRTVKVFKDSFNAVAANNSISHKTNAKGIDVDVLIGDFTNGNKLNIEEIKKRKTNSWGVHYTKFININMSVEKIELPLDKTVNIVTVPTDIAVKNALEKSDIGIDIASLRNTVPAILKEALSKNGVSIKGKPSVTFIEPQGEMETDIYSVIDKDANIIKAPVSKGAGIATITFRVKEKTTKFKINNMLQNAAKGELSSVLGIAKFDEEPVSSYFEHSEKLAIVDFKQTFVDEDLVTVTVWFSDWGYANSLKELSKKIVTEKQIKEKNNLSQYAIEELRLGSIPAKPQIKHYVYKPIQKAIKILEEHYIKTGKKPRIMIYGGRGRIGKAELRMLLDNPYINLVAIGAVDDIRDAVEFFKYDTIHGEMGADISYGTNKQGIQYCIINGHKIEVYPREKDLSKLPVSKLNIDMIMDVTGSFLTNDKAFPFLKTGQVKKVIFSAPAKEKVDATVVIGVNENFLDGSEKIISNASCTTNCAAPVLKILNEGFGIQKSFVETAHAITQKQTVIDKHSSSARVGRDGRDNLIPSTSGAAKAIEEVIPELVNKINVGAYRIANPDVSVVIEKSILPDRDTPYTKDEINNYIKNRADGDLKGVLGYVDRDYPLSSGELIGSRDTTIIEMLYTKVEVDPGTNETLLTTVTWYDNEIGFSDRYVNLSLLSFAKELELNAPLTTKDKGNIASILAILVKADGRPLTFAQVMEKLREKNITLDAVSCQRLLNYLAIMRMDIKKDVPNNGDKRKAGFSYRTIRVAGRGPSVKKKGAFTSLIPQEHIKWAGADAVILNNGPEKDPKELKKEIQKAHFLGLTPVVMLKGVFSSESGRVKKGDEDWISWMKRRNTRKESLPKEIEKQRKTFRAHSRYIKLSAQIDNYLKKTELYLLTKEQMINTIIVFETPYPIKQEVLAEIFAFLRGKIASGFGQDTADKVKILYKAPIKENEVESILSMKNIDGCFIDIEKDLNGSIRTKESLKKILDNAAEVLQIQIPIILTNGNSHNLGLDPDELITLLDKYKNDLDFIVAPPYTEIYQYDQAVKGKTVELKPIEQREVPVAIGVQGTHHIKSGEKKDSFTTEITISDVEDQADFYIVGHSERRAAGQTSENIALELKEAHKAAAKKKGGFVIHCIGEVEDQFITGVSEQIVKKQLNKETAGLTLNEILNTKFAYEPVWAIGTGKAATPEIAQHMHKVIREELAKIIEKKVRSGDSGQTTKNKSLKSVEDITILYGGSVKPDNAEELIAQKDINGFLIGGASLNAKQLREISEIVEDYADGKTAKSGVFANWKASELKTPIPQFRIQFADFDFTNKVDVGLGVAYTDLTRVIEAFSKDRVSETMTKEFKNNKIFEKKIQTGKIKNALDKPIESIEDNLSNIEGSSV